ncbi:reverse transcriptase domain-containing protein [Tanacetum coccineum]
MAPKRATRSTPVTTTPAPTATTTTSVTNAQLQAMIDQGVTAALAACDANKNGDDSHTSGTGGRRTERVARECTYQDFMKCKPLYFKGTEGVIELTQWFERMETILRIRKCSVENQINHDIAYAMTWADLRKKMTDKYCPRNEMKKLEAELWNLKVKGTNVIGYVGGLPDMIHGNTVASKPKTMLEAVEIDTELMDKKVSTITKGSLKTLPETIKTNNNRRRGRILAGLILQGLVKRSHTRDLKPYAINATITTTVCVLQGSVVLSKCHKCNKFGHFARDCRSAGNANNANNQRGTGSGQKSTCFECGVQGHFKRECPKLKNNKNRGNQDGK